MLLLRHEPPGVPLDVSLASLPFEIEAIAAARDCDFAGVSIRVPRPDDLIVYKIVAGRARDLDDVERLLVLHGPSLDLPRMRRIVREFADALEDPKRIETFGQLLRRAGLE